MTIQKQYQTTYKNLNSKSINAVKRLIKTNRFFKQNKPLKLFLLTDLKKELCEVYKIPKDKQPTLKIMTFSDGFYDDLENEICLNYLKLSLVTFLHEFKHFLQRHFNKTNNEEIARGWSLSLFYNATPKHFKNAVRKGLILYQNKFIDGEVETYFK